MKYNVIPLEAVVFIFGQLAISYLAKLVACKNFIELDSAQESFPNLSALLLLLALDHLQLT